MPIVQPVSFAGQDTVRTWNILARVGQNGMKNGMDVKLVQWLMYCMSRPRGSVLPFTSVNGLWDAASKAAIANYEKRESNVVLADGCVDPVRPGQVLGSIHHKLYKMLDLQIAYVVIYCSPKTTTWTQLMKLGLTMTDFESVLMNMPEDNDDMPSDLRTAMVNTRDSGSLEY